MYFSAEGGDVCMWPCTSVPRKTFFKNSVYMNTISRICLNFLFGEKQTMLYATDLRGNDFAGAAGVTIQIKLKVPEAPPKS